MASLTLHLSRHTMHGACNLVLADAEVAAYGGSSVGESDPLSRKPAKFWRGFSVTIQTASMAKIVFFNFFLPSLPGILHRRVHRCRRKLHTAVQSMFCSALCQVSYASL